MTAPADELLGTLKLAVAAANDAEQNVTTAQAELVSRSKRVGMLLLEAKKLHPAVKDFEAFLKKVDGLKLSRAYDLLRLAGGRTMRIFERKPAIVLRGTAPGRSCRGRSQSLPLHPLL